MAEKFTQHTGPVVPLDAANVDTDAIIPKQFLQKVTRTGFGAHLFNDWRFLGRKGPTAKSGIRVELSGISRRVDTVGAGKLWLRLVTRARAVGVDRLRL